MSDQQAQQGTDAHERTLLASDALGRALAMLEERESRWS